MRDEIEHMVIDTRVRPSTAEPPVDPDLEINIEPIDVDLYDVDYTRKVVEGESTKHVTIYFFALTREEMIREHVFHIRDVNPKTVLVRSGADQQTLLHPGVVKLIVERKLGVAEIILR